MLPTINHISNLCYLTFALFFLISFNILEVENRGYNKVIKGFLRGEILEM